MTQKLQNVAFGCNAIDYRNLGALCFELVGNEDELLIIDEMVKEKITWESVKVGSRKIFVNSLVFNDPPEALSELHRITEYKIDLMQALVWLDRSF